MFSLLFDFRSDCGIKIIVLEYQRYSITKSTVQYKKFRFSLFTLSLDSVSRIAAAILADQSCSSPSLAACNKYSRPLLLINLNTN